ncbi:MAG: PaaI family thioesterase [Jatrophihabitans sp.]
MDATALARQALETIPANQLCDLRVLSATDGVATVGVEVTPRLTNGIGSLHSGGLISLIDAAGLAALLSCASKLEQTQDVLPLGSDADLTFFAPARGTLVARCVLDDDAVRLAGSLFRGESDRIALLTDAEVVDAEGTVVCTGRFRWQVKRLAGV